MQYTTIRLAKKITIRNRFNIYRLHFFNKSFFYAHTCTCNILVNLERENVTSKWIFTFLIINSFTGICVVCTISKMFNEKSKLSINFNSKTSPKYPPIAGSWWEWIRNGRGTRVLVCNCISAQNIESKVINIYVLAWGRLTTFVY